MINVWGVGYRLVDGDPRDARRTRHEAHAAAPPQAAATRAAAGAPGRAEPQHAIAPGPWRKPGREERSNGRAPFAASEAQRATMLGAACVVCQRTKGITPAHLAARSPAAAITPTASFRCAGCTTAPTTSAGSSCCRTWSRFGVEVAHAILHLGLVGAYRRLGRAWAASGRAPSPAAMARANRDAERTGVHPQVAAAPPLAQDRSVRRDGSRNGANLGRSAHAPPLSTLSHPG